jgi:hypothetical protein
MGSGEPGVKVENSDAVTFGDQSIHSYAQAQIGCGFFALVESNRGG